MAFSSSQSAQNYLQQAQKARKEKRIQDAISLYQQVLRTNASNVAAQKALGDIYFSQKDYSLAKKYYIEAMKLSSEDSFICLRLGRIADILGQWDEAVTHYEHAAYLNPREFGAYQHLAEGYFVRKQLEKAEDKYKKAIEAGSPMPWVRFKIGQIARQKGDVQTAIDYFQKAIALNPNNPNFKLTLGDVYFSQKELQQAEEAYKAAITIKQDLFPAHFKLGRTYQMRQQLNDAIASFNTAIELKPQDFQSHQWVGEAHFAKKTYSLAESHYSKAIDLGSSAPWVRFKLGRIAQIQKDLEKATAYFENAIALNPKNPQFHYCLGTVQAQQGEIENAKASYEKALSINSNHKPSQEGLWALEEKMEGNGVSPQPEVALPTVAKPEVVQAELRIADKKNAVEEKTVATVDPNIVAQAPMEAPTSETQSSADAMRNGQSAGYQIKPATSEPAEEEPHPNGFIEKIWQRLFG